MKFLYRLLFSVSLAIAACSANAGESAWQQYKRAFVSPDGRVIDTGNHDISHSEGQGFGMLLAVFNDDKPAFDHIWSWTRQTLYRDDVGLFAWRYEPQAKVPIADANTASDGDTLIAWALLMAGQKWNDKRYLLVSSLIQTSLINHAIVSFGGYTVMLPGVDGFTHPGRVTLNPSYFIFPAWRDFYQSSHNEIWQTLINSGRLQLINMRFGDDGLPTDWVDLDQAGQFSPAVGWPPRFSFDAVRIPLYLSWAGIADDTMAPYIKYWSKYSRGVAPAWIDVVKNQTAEYAMTTGMLAVRDLILAGKAPIAATLARDEDYYSASLHLLAFYAQHRRVE
ncbi:glycosyl hydrolase family 8 [Acerihabitans arboris]|uniref:Glucanase n=1 Tax=Acerihabitans arboris TaxID=2691583 RepID=A0A845SE85_9GAMM|nr:glycosyl hydrolase family 8 [Acerihabitans arboris]NDL61687.1 endoglucanase [Acerihabitans arboris]